MLKKAYKKANTASTNEAPRPLLDKAKRNTPAIKQIAPISMHSNLMVEISPWLEALNRNGSSLHKPSSMMAPMPAQTRRNVFKRSIYPL